MGFEQLFRKLLSMWPGEGDWAARLFNKRATRRGHEGGAWRADGPALQIPQCCRSKAGGQTN